MTQSRRFIPPAGVALLLASLATSFPSGARADGTKYFDLAGQAARKAGVDECFAYVVLFHESRGSADLVGHDEDYPLKNHVPSRDSFLESGKKYSGATFPPQPKCTKPSGQRQSCNSVKITND